MKNPWEQDNCAAMRALHEVYSILQAAALWCEVPEDQTQEILSDAKPISESGVGRCIWEHPDIPCLQPKTRAIAMAIESGALPHGREDGKTVDAGEHVAYERRHVLGRHLREWMETTLPSEKPAFLFYEIERNTHHSITIESYESLKAENETLKRRIEKAESEYRKIRNEKDSLHRELEAIKKTPDGDKTPSPRSELTYNTIIAALVEVILGEAPNIDKHQSIGNKTELVNKIAEHYDEYPGISDRNLFEKFGSAKRALKIPR